MLRKLISKTGRHWSDLSVLPRELWITHQPAANAACLIAFSAAMVPALVESGGRSFLEIGLSSSIVATPVLLVPRWPRVALAASTAGAILAAAVWLVLAFELPVVLVLAAVASVRAASPWFLVGCGTVSLTLPYVLDGWLFEEAVALSASQTVATVILGVTFSVLSVTFGALLTLSSEQAERLVAFERSESDAALARQRQAIARELHDVAAHHLAALSVRLRTEQMVGTEPSDASLAYAADQSDQALASMRQIVRVLRSDAAVPEPPGATLNDLDGFFDRITDAGIQVDFAGDVNSLDVSPAFQITIVRVVQEALINVLQHSKADHVSVTISGTEKQITIAIDDPGPSRPKSPDERTGFGLIGLSELVDAAGGTFTSEVSPTGGWTTYASLPRTTQP